VGIQVVSHAKFRHAVIVFFDSTKFE
jgi:hypothetical protein